MANGGDDLMIFLSTGRLFMSDGARILVYDFPQGIVTDWDVTNRGVFQDSLANFIIVNKIEPSPITFILSEQACFSKDIVIKEPEKLDEATAMFLDAVPFNYVISKVYRVGSGVRVIAGNKDMIDSVAEVFEDKGFPLFAVVPAAIFPEVGSKAELDMQFVKAVSDNKVLIQTGNMVTPKALPPEIAAEHSQPITTTKASSGFLPYLIGVGAIAIVVLIVLVMLRR